MDFASSSVGLLVVGAAGLFWIGMLGLLWRRSLVGMLVGLLFAWISVAMGAIGFAVLQGDLDNSSAGGALVLAHATLSMNTVSMGGASSTWPRCPASGWPAATLAMP